MIRQHDSSGHPAPAEGFAATRWSMVRRALAGGEPLNTWIGLYWFPLYAWARRVGTSPEDASDQVQEFMGSFCRKNLLAKADPARGSLRAWLLTCFDNHLRSAHRAATAARRGGGAPHISIDGNIAESIYLADTGTPGMTPDQVYSRAWALTLMDEALEALADYYAQRGQQALCEALMPALEAPLPDRTFDDVASSLGMKAPAVRQAAVRLRQRYRRLLLEKAASRLGITCEDRLNAELREMLTGNCHNSPSSG